MLKHPLIKDYMMRVLTNKKDPVEALSEANLLASEYVRHLGKTFADVMNNQ
jgi:DNA-directed RNA polymerase subunit L